MTEPLLTPLYADLLQQARVNTHEFPWFASHAASH